MTPKELLIQEIETLPAKLLPKALDLIRSIKVSHTKTDAEDLVDALTWSENDIRECPQLVHDSTETNSDREQLTYRPASGRSILRHAGTWEGDDFKECLAK